MPAIGAEMATVDLDQAGVNPAMAGGAQTDDRPVDILASRGEPVAVEDLVGVLPAEHTPACHLLADRLDPGTTQYRGR